MKKTTLKMKRTLVITVLLAISCLMIGTIYMINTRQNTTNDLRANEVKGEIQVDAVEAEIGNVEAIKLEEKMDDVVIQELEVSDNITNSNPKAQDETVEEPMPVEPEKPVNTPPDKIPQTRDNVENTDKIPEYSEEETTYTPEEPVQEKKQVDTGTKEESNLVPDSQNPFANPGNTGTPNEMNSSEYSDYVPGTGDKF